MSIFSKNLVKSEKLEKLIGHTCSFNNLKCEFIQGRILSLEETNISFIEPHRVIINIKNKKLLLIYYDEYNLFLYNRSNQIDIRKLDKILKAVKEDLSNG